jgi:choline dehydrogenase-like flavoprotein
MVKHAADICIIGGGPAGLAVASRTVAAGLDTIVVESGGRTTEANADLKRGVVRAAAGADPTLLRRAPSLYPDHHLETGRYRGIGGAGNLWSVRRNVSAPRTFRAARPEPGHRAAKPKFDIPAWPIDPAEVDRWLDEACHFLQMPATTMAPADWDDTSVPMDLGAMMRPAVLAFPARSFVIEELVASLAASGVTCIGGATFVGADRRGGSLRAVRAVDVDGEVHEISADRFVLSLGGIENARALLNLQGDGVIENSADTIGRFFMDHPHARLGVIEPDADISALTFHDHRELRDYPVLGVQHLDPTLAIADDLLSFSVTMLGRPALDVSPSARSVAHLVNGLRRRRLPRGAARDVATIACTPIQAYRFLRDRTGSRRHHHSALGGWSDPATAVHDVDVLAVETMMEQRPSGDNRITLDTETDRHGRRRARIEWSWSQLEIDSYWASVELMAEAVRANGAGVFHDARTLGSGPVPNASTGWHHMGTTRMSTDAADGVVDPDARLFELENLYVAGSSVFPSSAGWANPTLTLIALALRLGDHLASN